MDLKVEGEREKYCRPPSLAEKNSFWILDAPEWLAVTFWPWWEPFHSFWFETLSFFFRFESGSETFKGKLRLRRIFYQGLLKKFTNFL